MTFDVLVRRLLRVAALASACVLVVLPVAGTPALADHGHGNGNGSPWEEEGWADEGWEEEAEKDAWEDEAPAPAPAAPVAAEEDPWGEPWDDSDQDVVLPATPVEALPVESTPAKKTSGRTTTGRAANVPYGKLIASTARRHGLSVSLFTALVWQESGFKARARSRVGAMGLTQLMPATARGLGVKNPWSPAQNLNGGARYLKAQLRRFGSARLALAAYNAGPGAVARYRGIPPYAETRNYVKRILGLRARLKRAGVR